MPDSKPPRDVMEYDVLIVGAGPSGLACAIRLKQLAREKKRDLSVCVIEKGSEVGAHLMSGAVFEPRALNELFPNWRNMDTPLKVPVTEDRFMFLTSAGAWRLPTPPPMHNRGNYVISLGYFAKWLATQAEALGVEIYPGFAAAEVLYSEQGRVIGVATGDAGIGKNGEPTARFTRGVELKAKQTVFAEGCRGSLTKMLIQRFKLYDDTDPQTYGLGIKEIWEIDPAKHRAGFVMHSVGWPMDRRTYGGSWMYHWEKNLVSIGFVVGLDYENPFLSPFEEFQRFKLHPLIQGYLVGGKRISYGARALSEGGMQSIPRLTFPGGLLIGDTAGFLNVAKIKGNHTAMKSGMVAAESIFDHIAQGGPGAEVIRYPARLKESWLWRELETVRNIRPGFRAGLFAGLANGALESLILRGKGPWTLRNHEDFAQLKPARSSRKIEYPKPDGVTTFDRLSSVFLSNTNHEEDQPPHLKLRKPDLAISVNLAQYDSPESRYCPAGVYEIVRDGTEPRLQINAQNCVHCKTCDIKDPRQNIDWCVPEGGGGPNYQGM
jgi:electron-transferring-flavoprotein dehydrogenase